MLLVVRACAARRLAAAGIASTFAVLVLTEAAAADAFPARVQATYDINFNGLKVGTFDFNSTQQGPAYTLTGAAQMSLLFGALKWRGDAKASGNAAADAAPKPAAFQFNYAGGKKSGSTKVAYSGDTITQVLHDPPKEPKEGLVPVQPAHLKAVLDPMTAVLALTKGTTGNPCSRRIPVYDGKARFDLLLTPRGVVQLTEKTPSGQPGTGYVCRVKYVPVAGHKPDEETKFMSMSDGIEVVLRPIPSANVFVPYKVTIPTVAGPATLVSTRVDITTSSQRIALSH
jgi:hypothetical protein